MSGGIGSGCVSGICWDQGSGVDPKEGIRGIGGNGGKSGKRGRHQEGKGSKGSDQESGVSDLLLWSDLMFDVWCLMFDV